VRLPVRVTSGIDSPVTTADALDDRAMRAGVGNLGPEALDDLVGRLTVFGSSS
jgi:hypothetical protein